MIRPYLSSDTDVVLQIWLNASIAAHDFVDPEFWRSQLDNMRDIYLPASEIHVYETSSQVCGFYALVEERLAAIFVASQMQGRGIGKALLTHAKAQRDKLALTVYSANRNAVQFYQAQGFAIAGERLDEATGHPELLMQWAAARALA